jgi:hypothetical protein
MDKKELIQAIRQLTKCISDYKTDEKNASQKTEGNVSLDSIIDKVNANKELLEARDHLVKEANTLGPAGRACPICHGTGKA